MDDEFLQFTRDFQYKALIKKKKNIWRKNWFKSKNINAHWIQLNPLYALARLWAFTTTPTINWNYMKLVDLFVWFILHIIIYLFIFSLHDKRSKFYFLFLSVTRSQFNILNLRKRLIINWNVIKLITNIKLLLFQLKHII